MGKLRSETIFYFQEKNDLKERIVLFYYIKNVIPVKRLSMHV